MLNSLTAVFETAEEGGFVCWFEEIPEVMSQGETQEEATANLIDALKEVLAYRRNQAKQEIALSKNKSIKEITIEI